METILLASGGWIPPEFLFGLLLMGATTVFVGLLAVAALSWVIYLVVKPGGKLAGGRSARPRRGVR
jgi:hypothetical protein